MKQMTKKQMALKMADYFMKHLQYLIFANPDDFGISAVEDKIAFYTRKAAAAR